MTSSKEIENVARISANGDVVIGKLIADAMEKVGASGTITVAEGKTLHHELEVVEGLKFDRGYLSPYFITNSKNQKAELENCLVFIYDKKLSNVKSILGLLEMVVQTNQPLMILADDIDSEVVATLVLNRIRVGMKVVAVKAPGFGDNRKAMLKDIATACGANVVCEELGMKLDDKFDFHPVLGTAKSITISKDDTVILNGGGGKAQIDERCDEIKAAIDATSSQYDKEKLQERLAKLSGGVAVIKVGGASEVEVGEIKDRVNDALCATKAAVEEGIVPGGGVTLLYATTALENLPTDNLDQKVGVDIVKHALKVPCMTIAKNAGQEGAVVVGDLLRDNDHNRGFNAQTGEYVDMIESGIIDPTKVVRTALADAASVSSVMVTTEATITEIPEEKKSMPNPGQMGGGMGGMEGMF